MGLGTLGAMIILLSFSMDPFTQQISSFPQHSVVGEPAMVRWMRNYAGPSTTYYKADGAVEPNSLGELLHHPDFFSAFAIC